MQRHEKGREGYCKSVSATSLCKWLVAYMLSLFVTICPCICRSFAAICRRNSLFMAHASFRNKICDVSRFFFARQKEDESSHHRKIQAGFELRNSLEAEDVQWVANSVDFLMDVAIIGGGLAGLSFAASIVKAWKQSRCRTVPGLICDTCPKGFPNQPMFE